MSYANNIRQSINSITLTGSSTKRVPSKQEIKEYNNLQREIQESVSKYNLEQLLSSKNASQTTTGQNIVRDLLNDFTANLLDLLEGRKLPSLESLKTYCKARPEKGDTYESRAKELALATLMTTCNHTVGEDAEVGQQRLEQALGRLIAPTLSTHLHKHYKRLEYLSNKEFTAPTRTECDIECYTEDAVTDRALACKLTGHRIGTQLIELLLSTCPIFIQTKRTEKKKGGIRTPLYISIDPEYLDSCRAITRAAVGQNLPSIERPRKQTTSSRFGIPLVRNAKYTNQKTLPENKVFTQPKENHSIETMPEVYQVLRDIEATEYTIDTEVLEILQLCIQQDITVPGLNTKIALPPMPPTQYQFDNEAEFVQDAQAYLQENTDLPELWYTIPHTKLISKWHKLRKEVIANLSKTEAGLRSLNTANSLKEYEKLWVPHNTDTRGRVYPVPSSLNPQLNDISKGLLKFAEPDPVGPIDSEAAKWLRINIATLWGNDVEVELTEAELLHEIYAVTGQTMNELSSEILGELTD